MPAPLDPDSVVTIGDVEIDFARMEVYRGGQAVPLGQMGRAILFAVAEARGRAVPTGKLYSILWDLPGGVAMESGNRAVDQHIVRLRKRLGPGVILTVRGYGWRLNL
jgi:two-component system OmpR family response regulator